MLFDNTSHPVVETLSFDSFTEAIEKVDLINSPAINRHTLYGGKLDSSFFGVSSVAEAKKLATLGWPEGRDKFRAIADSINVESHILKPEIVYDVVGDGGFDMGRVLAGVPESTMDWRETETQLANPNGQIIKILFNTVTSGMVSTKVIETRGAAVLALVDALESAGKRVELDALYYIGASYGVKAKKAHKIIVPLKKLDYAVQQDQIIYALAHPSFMRVYMFSLLAMAGPNGHKSASLTCGSFGTERDYPLEADIVISSGYGLDGQWSSVANAKAWLVETLHTFGVRLDTDGKI